MDRLKFCLSALIIGVMSTVTYAKPVTTIATNTPVGYWKTIDDVTGKPKSIIHIWQTENKALAGQVVKIFPKEGDDPNKLCVACEGENHNKPIVGMVVLSGLRATQGQWDEGRILDPENGKTYSCSMHMADEGKRLNLRGYIGIPLLGRSQIWERVDSVN